MRTRDAVEGRIAASDPGTASEYSHAVRLNNQAVQFQEQGNFAEAESALREAAAAWERLPSPLSAGMTVTLNNLGNLLRVQGHFREAERLLRRAIVIQEGAGASAPLDLVDTLNALGALYCDIGEPARGMPLLERGLHIREQLLGPNHPLIAYSLDKMADALVQKRHAEQAEAVYRRSLSLIENRTEHATLLATTSSKLADLYFRKLRKLQPAEELYQHALEAWKCAPEHDHPQIGLTLSGLAELYLSQRRYAEAEPLLKQALEIQERALGPAHPQVAKILLDYASLLHKQHRPREAAPMEKRARGIMRSFRGENPGRDTVDVSTLQRPR